LILDLIEVINSIDLLIFCLSYNILFPYLGLYDYMGDNNINS